MKDKVKIEMTEDQQTWLLRFMNYEWDAECEYQYQNREADSQYLEDMLDVYEAVLGKADNIFEAISIEYDIESKKKQLEEMDAEEAENSSNCPIRGNLSTK